MSDAKRKLKGKWQSAIYKGQIRHRRFEPKSHAFTYPIFMLYLDLDELPALIAKKWYCSFSGLNFVRFKRGDFFAPKKPSLKQAIIEKVADSVTPDLAASIKSVRGLMHLRYLNIVFNPVVFYYCYDADDKLVAIVSEITNTPWDDRHAYVLPIGDDHSEAPETSPRYSLKGKGKHQFEFQKMFHVSPFNPMNMDYRWVFSQPGEKLFVHMDNLMNESEAVSTKQVKHFDATLVLNRYDFDKNLAKTLIQYPFMTVKVITGIYWQALKLKLKGVPFYDHPKTLKP
tara:strand:- start:4405 stop:5259 length:855 start_codon:yes stop_codon:yes gene_type:complete